jgi:hypothetical protein
MVLKSLFGKKGETQKTAGIPGMADAPSASASEPSKSPERAPGAEAAATNPGEPTPAVYLEQAMLENARNDSPDSRRKVYQELLFSDLLLALADEADGEGAKSNEDSKDPNNLSVAILTNSGGIQFAAAFTSAAAARRWRAEGGQYVAVRGQDIFKLLEPSPAEVVVINAGSAPFIVLPKVEYRQLAMGIVPQNGPSPVQVAAAAPGQGAPGQEAQADGQADDGQMQVAFPPDVFNEEQKAHALEVMGALEQVEAAVLGAILPPGTGERGWIRTLFIRVSGVEESQEAMQAFCADVRQSIASKEELFNEVGFEVGVMPDPNFWSAMHQNGIVLFDKNPPSVTATEGKEGVLDASMENKA